MLDDNFSAMRQSIIDGAPDTATSLAQQAVSAGIAPIDAINHGCVPGMPDVGEQFARGQMYLPDMMASAEAMRAAMAVLDAEMKNLGTERATAGVVVLGRPRATSTKSAISSSERCSPRMVSASAISAWMSPERSSLPKRRNSMPTSSASRRCKRP